MEAGRQPVSTVIIRAEQDADKCAHGTVAGHVTRHNVITVGLMVEQLNPDYGAAGDVVLPV